MKSEKENRSKKTEQKAKDVAKVMLDNMKHNMEDPDFLRKKERRMQKAANKALESLKESDNGDG